MSLYIQPNTMLCFHTHSCPAPWQTDAWKEWMRTSSRPSAYLRHVENKFTSGESQFIDLEWWDACIDHSLSPVVSDPQLPVWIGLDAATKHDFAACMVVTWEAKLKKIRLVFHRIWHPSPSDPLDFEETFEALLLDLRRRFKIIKIFYDPWQLVSTGQRLTKAGLPMEEFPQTVPNLTESSTCLYELVKGNNLILYADAEMRLAASHAIAKESARGWRIAKEKASNKIDAIVALASASLAAQRAGYAPQKRKARIDAGTREMEEYVAGHALEPPSNSQHL